MPQYGTAAVPTGVTKYSGVFSSAAVVGRSSRLTTDSNHVIVKLVRGKPSQEETEFVFQ